MLQTKLLRDKSAFYQNKNHLNILNTSNTKKHGEWQIFNSVYLTIHKYSQLQFTINKTIEFNPTPTHIKFIIQIKC